MTDTSDLLKTLAHYPSTDVTADIVPPPSTQWRCARCDGVSDMAHSRRCPKRLWAANTDKDES